MSAVLEGAKEGNMSKIQAELALGANIDFKDEVKFRALLGLPQHSPFVEPLSKGRLICWHDNPSVSNDLKCQVQSLSLIPQNFSHCVVRIA